MAQIVQAATTWQHRGIDISLVGARFKCQFDGVAIVKDSLAAVKKDLDKRLGEKAKAVKLNLPIVSWRTNTWMNSDKSAVEGIAHEIITGVAVEKNKMILEGIDSIWKRSYILPDTPDNEKLILDLRAAKQTVLELEMKIESSEIGLYFGSKPVCAQVVEGLQANYARALKTVKPSR